MLLFSMVGLETILEILLKCVSKKLWNFWKCHIKKYSKVCWTRIQHQEYLQPGDDFSKLFSFHIFGFPGGTAKEK